MKNLHSKKGLLFNALLSSALTALFVTATVSAATTISTNINTGGTLTVTGASTLTGAVTTAGDVTLGDAGADVITITGNASTTNSFEVGNFLYVNGYATTTGTNGNFATLGTIVGSSTAQFTGALTSYGSVTLGDAGADAITLTGNASTTNALTVGTVLYVGGRATTTASNGNFHIHGTASSSALIVGGDSVSGTVSGIVFGTCNIVGTGTHSITASTTGGVACTGATGVTTAFKVFVMATSSLTSAPTDVGGGFIIQGASSTASATIGVNVYNASSTAATPAGTLNFWAFR